MKYFSDFKMKHRIFLSGMLLVLGARPAIAAEPAATSTATTPVPAVTATGEVPDQATKNSILSKLREVYGADRVIDQISVSNVVMPANWASHVQGVLSPALKTVSKGELQIDGNTIAIKGEVASDPQRTELATQIASALNPTYLVKNQLHVAAAEQTLLDKTLANRIVEFESGSAKIAPAGQTLLDEMSTVLAQLKGRRVQIIGNTDSQGSHDSNVALSKARAEAVKSYLVQKGLAADNLIPLGVGPDHPVASNTTEDGRRRNRRIEFQLSQ